MPKVTPSPSSSRPPSPGLVPLPLRPSASKGNPVASSSRGVNELLPAGRAPSVPRSAGSSRSSTAAPPAPDMMQDLMQELDGMLESIEVPTSARALPKHQKTEEMSDTVEQVMDSEIRALFHSADDVPLAGLPTEQAIEDFIGTLRRSESSTRSDSPTGSESTGARSASTQNHDVEDTASVLAEAQIVQEAIDSAGTAPAFPPDPIDTPQVSRFKRSASLLAAFTRLHANKDFTSTGAKIGASAYNVVTRNALGVFLPTMLRQFIGQGVEAGFIATGASSAVRTTVGLGMPAAAIGALGLGWMRDRAQGTQTSTSVRSRAIMALATLASAVLSASRGAVADSASNMVAFTAYTTMRDPSVQSWLRLNNDNMEAHKQAGVAGDWKHFLTISLLYGVYQGLVNRTMSEYASPSGPSAAGAGLTVGTVVAHAAARGAINMLGEVGEDLTFQSIPAIRSWYNAKLHGQGEAHALQLGTSIEANTGNLKNAMMGPWAVRTGILSMTLGLVTVASRSASLAENPVLLNALADIIIGATNAVLYEPFANAGSAQPGPRVDDQESVAGTINDADIALTQLPDTASRTGHPS